MRIVTPSGCIEPLHSSQAKELFDLVHRNRGFLHPWLPWLVNIHSALDTEVFINKLLQKEGPQFVIRLDDNSLCGGINFHSVEEAPKSAILGYWIGEDFVGQGIMDGALLASCDFAFRPSDKARKFTGESSALALEQGTFEQLEIRCSANNIAGCKVPERLGFTLREIIPKAAWLTDSYVDHACYCLSKDQYLNR